MLQVSRVRAALTATVSLLFAFPLIIGEGCPGPVTPINTDVASTIDTGTGTGPDTGGSGTGTTGNTPPSFTFTSPTQDVSLEAGDVFQLTWTASDPDNNASIEILLDPDGTFGNGNERIIVPLILEDSGVTTFNVDTAALALAPASYRVIAKVNDGVNPELLVVAPGHILLFGKGLLVGNKAPTIVTTKPDQNIGASQNDVVNIAYCGKDPDNGIAGDVPDVVILLDLDTDPNNDLDLKSSSAASNLISICQGGLPKAIPGAIVLACKKDDDCQTIASATQFALTVDVGLIPPTASGLPYHVRTTMWDHTNSPISSYAAGTLNITALGSGTIDLSTVGKTSSGARFQGFDAGGLAGFAGTSLGDFDGDGADDFIIVARYGRPFERGPVGSAFMVYGQKGQKLSGDISLNSVGARYRGAYFSMGAGACGFTVPATQGIKSVNRIADLNGDGKPEILFGMPYVEQVFDYLQDDDCAPGCCYGDLLPNPLSANNSLLGNFDQFEDALCSNDLDTINATPINQGYAISVFSDNLLEGTVIDLPLVGMHDGVSNDECTVFGATDAPNGARFRGGWYPFEDFNFTQTGHPSAIIPDNSFGETVSSLPDMSNGGLPAQKDGQQELLISAPGSFNTRGGITMVFGGNYESFSGKNKVSSIPIYTFGPCCTRGLLRPVDRELRGAAVGDRFGYASSAGDFNLDGSPDILCGAPGATRNGVTAGGIVYIIFGRIDFGNLDLSKQNPPRVEIHGTNAGDAFGSMQTLVGDVNQDSIPDIGFASSVADGPGGVDSGFVGIVFGGQQLTGENIFTVSQVGTAQLPGAKFFGSQAGGLAGATISNVGDFNGDSIDDLLISAPGETRTVNGQVRKGVAYLIFGGPHLNNLSISLAQVGSAQLPGIVFVSPYALGSADEAPIDSVVGAGDVNGDGFADILIGVSKADYVNPLEPTQRRVDAGEMYLIYGSNTGSNALK